VASFARFRLVAGFLRRSLAVLVVYLASPLVTGVSQTMSEGCPDSGESAIGATAVAWRRLLSRD
jgi:hypothetical protein